MSNVAITSASASAKNNTPEALQIPVTINLRRGNLRQITRKGREKRNHGQPYSKEEIEKGYFPENAVAKLAKNKSDKTAQRIFFHEISQEGIQFIRNFLSDSDKDEEENLAHTQSLSASEISANLKKGFIFL